MKTWQKSRSSWHLLQSFGARRIAISQKRHCLARLVLPLYVRKVDWPTENNRTKRKYGHSHEEIVISNEFFVKFLAIITPRNIIEVPQCSSENFFDEKERNFRTRQDEKTSKQ